MIALCGFIGTVVRCGIMRLVWVMCVVVVNVFVMFFMMCVKCSRMLFVCGLVIVFSGS